MPTSTSPPASPLLWTLKAQTWKLIVPPTPSPRPNRHHKQQTTNDKLLRQSNPPLPQKTSIPPQNRPSPSKKSPKQTHHPPPQAILTKMTRFTFHVFTFPAESPS